MFPFFIFFLIIVDEIIFFDLLSGEGIIVLYPSFFSYFLSKLSPGSTFLGIDQTPYLIDEAKKLSDGTNLNFEVGDIYDMPEKFKKNFDVSVCWKTLSWLPYYDEVMKSLVSSTKNYIFINGLFYEGDIDFQIKVREYKKEKGKTDFTLYYNVYSLPRFKKFVYR